MNRHHLRQRRNHHSGNYDDGVDVERDDADDAGDDDDGGVEGDNSNDLGDVGGDDVEHGYYAVNDGVVVTVVDCGDYVGGKALWTLEC